MSAIIQTELEAYGVANAIVYLRKDADTDVAESMLKHFVHSRTSRTAALAAATGIESTLLAAARYFPNLNVMLGTVSSASLADLGDEEVVEKVTGAPQISLIRPVERHAAAHKAEMTWGLRALGIQELWDEGLDGSGVRIAHLDTGVDGEHPSLKPAVRAFAQLDLFGREVKPTPHPFDTGDHGTHTAATIAGRPVDGRNIGVAPAADLLSAIVIEGGDVVARVLGGMDWAVGQEVQILNMSLGFHGWWDDFLGLTRLLRQRGVLPVIASGNEGPGTSRSPGNYAEALSVGASDRSGRVAGFSSSDRFQRPDNPVVPDLVAPGASVLSACPGGGYQFMSGTSMAAPHIAGLAALLWQARPQATVQEIEEAILVSCESLPGSPPERQGRGQPNGPRALAAL